MLSIRQQQSVEVLLMAAPKGTMPPAAGKGRVKGVPNKATTLAKDAIAAAAEGLGGADRLIAWAKEDPANERVFWGQIYTKLLPLQITGSGAGGAIAVTLSSGDESL
jgi:hypothetical protein